MTKRPLSDPKIVTSKCGLFRAVLVVHDAIIQDDNVHQLWNAQYRDKEGVWVECRDFTHPSGAIEHARVVSVIDAMF